MKAPFCCVQLIAEAYPGASVTVAAERFLQDTTSHGAAGLWEPYKLGARLGFMSWVCSALLMMLLHQEPYKLGALLGECAVLKFLWASDFLSWSADGATLERRHTRSNIAQLQRFMKRVQGSWDSSFVAPGAERVPEQISWWGGETCRQLHYRGDEKMVASSGIAL
jgi:hypothetical protein